MQLAENESKLYLLLNSYTQCITTLYINHWLKFSNQISMSPYNINGVWGLRDPDNVIK